MLTAGLGLVCNQPITPPILKNRKPERIVSVTADFTPATASNIAIRLEQLCNLRITGVLRKQAEKLGPQRRSRDEESDRQRWVLANHQREG